MSMGLGDYISEAAERKHIRGELAREEWEYENFPEGEKAEMIEIYKKKGFSEDDATLIINAMTEKEEYKDYFVHHMMTQVRRVIFSQPTPCLSLCTVLVHISKQSSIRLYFFSSMGSFYPFLDYQVSLFSIVQELGMQVPEDDNGPAKGGFFSFVSFLLFGSIPLL